MRIETGPRLVLSRADLELLTGRLDTTRHPLPVAPLIVVHPAFGRFEVTAEPTHVHRAHRVARLGVAEPGRRVVSDMTRDSESGYLDDPEFAEVPATLDRLERRLARLHETARAAIPSVNDVASVDIGLTYINGRDLSFDHPSKHFAKIKAGLDALGAVLAETSPEEKDPR